MDARLDQVPVVLDLAGALAGELAGLYVGGSLASGDYRAGVSDIDAVALVDRSPGPVLRRAIAAEHRRLVRESSTAAGLHCVYVSRSAAAEPAVRHWTWAFDELFRRELSGIARAELLAEPVVVFGPSPSAWLPPMNPDDLRAAARDALTRYWGRAVRRRAIWDQDVYVDQGLTAVARADLTIRGGRLVTKTEALPHLSLLGLPAHVLEEVVRRRAGETVPVTPAHRSERAAVVRRFMAENVDRLRRCPPPVAGFRHAGS